MDSLMLVRPASIPRWNEHKDVKEDKERDPCFFIPHDRTSAVDPRKIKQTADGGLIKPKSTAQFDQMATGTLVNLAMKGFKTKVEPTT